MDNNNEAKQRNRRRKRAQRMQAIREKQDNSKDDSGEEDDSNGTKEKPQRPPCRRKKAKEPLAEEDIIDGFAILAFKTYEDLEVSGPLCGVLRDVAEFRPYLLLLHRLWCVLSVQAIAAASGRARRTAVIRAKTPRCAIVLIRSCQL